MSLSAPPELGAPHAAPPRRLPWRTSAAAALARLVAAGSRRLGTGAGGVAGGRFALRLDPRALARLGRARTVVLVTGTNGKTTTTAMLSRVLGVLGEVAVNGDGANLPDGVTAALAARPRVPLAVLEVDEFHVPAVAAAVRPVCLVLLNLTRDQLDRVGEVRAVERALRKAVAELPGTTVVANCDDPLVVSVGLAASSAVWVAAGQTWHADATACARCGEPLRHEGADWSCRCGLTRPEPAWVLEDETAVLGDGVRVPLGLGLPGRANAANAALALATAATLGVPPRLAAERLSTITEVGGRYRRVEVHGRTVRLLLAKNPAGWRETLPMLEPGAPIVLAVNGREADGRDLSWLWDVPFGQLAGRTVVVSGERALDLAVRLTYAEVPHTVRPDPLDAISAAGPGPVELVANYTAFRDVSRRLAGRHG
ncbi:UDP-N-acetylmuramyl tripeptide synthase [Amycolatopsis sacchari]|uniref:Lipid II isoglutaminyl synthase (glutamine-hydrolyzing) subunit MurT n=1 Tax=Amycolatopsis sacchari TaxID=115433 RepID=A0A1I4B6Y7_9PSEU|nr:UDP-N-acetylmuramyl tripeptide synthase [Amycolatopsis sacchari]